jgi:hypothetical protein
MDHVALRLPGTRSWTWLGGDDGARKPREVVLRAFDRAVEFAVGSSREAPGGTPVLVPVGEGRRLAGTHFFARPVEAGASCRVSVRGI